MGLKKTILVAVIFAALLGLYLWDQGRIQKETAAQEEQKRLVTAAKADITGVSVEREGGKLQLRKEGGRWLMSAPVEARAGDSAVDGLVAQIDQAQRNEPFEVTEARLAEFGLAKPAARLEVKAAAKNYAAQIDIGAETPDGTQVYARSGGMGSIFTIPASVRQQLTRPAAELRDKRLVPADLSNAIAFEINDSSRTLAAGKQGEAWTLTAPEKLKGDADQIRQFLGGLNSAEASDFLDTPSLNLASLGLDPPRWRGRFTVADEGTTRTYELTVGDPVTSGSTELYAKCDADKYSVIARGQLVAKIHPTVTTLRDKSLFTLKSPDVGWITISLRGNPLYLERDSAGLWRIHGDPDTPVDQGKVSQVLAQLLALEATKFYKPDETPGVEAMGLVRPTLLVRVANRDRTTTESLETGAKPEGEEFVWGRMIDTDQVVGIDWTKPGTFFLTRDDVIERSLFTFEEEAAQRITIAQDGKTTLTLDRQPGGAWEARAAGRTTTRQIDAVRLTAILNALTGLRWEQRLDARNPTDQVLAQTQRLNKPLRRIGIFDANGKPIGTLGIGGETDKFSYVAAGGNFYSIDRDRMKILSDAVNELIGQFEGK